MTPPSDSPPLLLRTLAIRRLAGLGDAGFILDPLSPGINLIFGPNAVGKSRTAHAINLALWPALTDARNSIAAAFNIGPDSWSINIDADATRYQRNGVDAPNPPPLAAASESDRYNLALADLLAGSPDAFAAAIAKESAGGYDLTAAAAALDLTRKPTARDGPLTKAVQQAAAAARECQRRGDELRDGESRLEKLLHDRQTARVAVAQAAKLQAALDLADAHLRQQQADAALATFPPALATMTGQELPLLRQLRQDRDALAKDAADLARQRHETITALSATNLDDESAAAADTAPTALAQATRRLADLANQILIQRKAIDAAQARQESARAALGPETQPEQLAHLDLPNLTALAAATRECESAQLHLAALEEQHALLIDPASSPDPDAEVSRLETANFLLTSWLSEPDAQPPAETRRGERIIIAAAACVVILALLLAWRVHWSLAAAALAGPLLYWLWHRQLSPPPPPGAVRPALQSQYANLAVDPPSQWTTDAVRATSRSISQSLAAAHLRRQRAARRIEIEPKLAAAREQCERIAQQRQTLAQTLGTSIPTDSISLNALADALHAWRAADESAKSADAELRSLQAERDSLFATAGAAALRFGYTAADVHQLEAATDALRRRIDQHRAHRQRLSTLDAQAADNARRAAEIQRRIDSLFQSLNLANESDEPALQAYAAQRPEFESARKSATIAAARVAELSSTVDPHLTDCPREQLATDLQSATAIATTESNLTEQIVRIQTEVDAAKRGHALEEAEANRRDAAAILAADRDAKCAQIAGWALVEHLRQATRERNRPAVFRAAREIFARITRGRYRLEFDAPTTGKAAPNFVAIDSQTGIGQPLDQLSAGTRVQLLLAVRVAFVEQQERGPRLPLLLDEALANSDETRARQVIDAVIEIARTGRQIFYFTAQPDEIGKWREVLQPDENNPPIVPCRFIDLAAVRGLAATQRTPMRQLVTVPMQTVPPPESAHMDRAAYGRLLAVPGIDPQNDSPAPTHLWHLIDDLHLLHRLLSRGITTWGQLQTMRDYADPGDDRDAPAMHRALASAKMIATLARLWRIGRGRPLDRATLAEAPITEQFRDAIAAVAESVDWNPHALLTRLEENAVARFGQKKTEQLRQHFEETGHIDPRPPLSPDELRLAALAALQREIDASLLSPEQIETARQTWFQAADPQSPVPSPGTPGEG